MKRSLTTLTVASVLLCAVTYADTAALNTNHLSYAMGYKTGEALKAQSVTIDTKQFAQGLEDSYTGNKPRVSDQEMQTVLTNMQKEMMKKMQDKYQQIAEQNLTDGQKFLTDNAKKPGVVTTASGLQYKIINAGQGENPVATDTVTVNYEGTLINGKVFDSSYQRGKPATFQVGQVIQGWQEALKLMKPGATWMLYIPSNLAYGKQGAMGAIGPNETLIFKVDLMSIKK